VLFLSFVLGPDGPLNRIAAAPSAKVPGILFIPAFARVGQGRLCGYWMFFLKAFICCHFLTMIFFANFMMRVKVVRRNDFYFALYSLHFTFHTLYLMFGV
jgi:hypothetical protein